MAGFISDLKRGFLRGNIAVQFIYVNVGIFVVTTLISVLWMLFKLDGTFWLKYMELPAWIPDFLTQPWSLFTYMFLHADILHLLFNMLWLYWFSQLFLYFFSARHFRGLYLLGGLLGGIFFLISYAVFPYFEDKSPYAYLLGASASVLAIVVATAVREPEYSVKFMFLGSIRLKYVALLVVVTDLLFITSSNGGGHVAHLGGALAGWAFAYGLQRGTDITAWLNKGLDAVEQLFKRSPKPKKPKMKVHMGGRAQHQNYQAAQKPNSEEVDRILEKLKQSGYTNLTTEEKKTLFDASKR